MADWEARCQRLEAENDQFREALKSIGKDWGEPFSRRIAREALAVSDEKEEE